MPGRNETFSREGMGEGEGKHSGDKPRRGPRKQGMKPPPHKDGGQQGGDQSGPSGPDDDDDEFSHSYGNGERNETNKAFKPEGEAECEDRQMYVVVTALEDDATAMLEFSAVDFSGANKIFIGLTALAIMIFGLQ